MAIQLLCPKCNVALNARSDDIGQRKKCPRCHEPIVVTEPSTPSAHPSLHAQTPPATDYRKAFLGLGWGCVAAVCLSALAFIVHDITSRRPQPASQPKTAVSPKSDNVQPNKAIVVQPVVGQNQLPVFDTFEAKKIRGMVVSITDGDTIVVLDASNTQHKIRLEGIDAPESGQPFGTKSRMALSDKIFGAPVLIKWFERGKYRRILGAVYLDDRHINHEMVEEGWAWHYRKYSSDKDLANAEVVARRGVLGLWSDPNPIPPWDWRKSGGRSELGGFASGNAREKKGASETQPTKAIVYITRTGSKYHADGCRYLSKSKIPISLSEAQQRYSPCSVCGGGKHSASSQQATSTKIEDKSSGDQSSEVTVYVTRTGSKYHSAGCRYLRKSSIPISLADAKKRYSACSVCGGGGHTATRKRHKQKSSYRRTAPRSSYSSSSSSGRVHVRGYYRKDGTYVRPHTRRRPRR